MASIALCFGQLEVKDFATVRSGVRWLCDDGHLCSPGEAIAFCNVGVRRAAGPRGAPLFSEEWKDLQAVLITPVGGVLRHGRSLNLGGFQTFQLVYAWAPEEIVAHIESQKEDEADAPACDVNLVIASGRRLTNLAEDRSGLLTGWFDQTRASKADEAGPIGTVLSLGNCEMLAIAGERRAFLEILAAARGPAQIVSVNDSALVHNARVIREQISRTPSEREVIARDLSRMLSAGGETLTTADWVFAGAMLNLLNRSPTEETHLVLGRNGLLRSGPADAIVLSLSSENRVVSRHKQLGYTVDFHGFRRPEAGPAFAAWMRENFEPVRHTIDDIRADLGALIDLVRSLRPATQFVISNVMSTSGQDDIQNYSAFDAPIGQTVSRVYGKDLNLMLCDVARERDIDFLDTDAIGAELGTGTHIPDGVHQSGIMQAEMREELLRILRARGVPGFGPPEVSRLRTRPPVAPVPQAPRTAVQPDRR